MVTTCPLTFLWIVRGFFYCPETEVKDMRKSVNAALTQREETAEELVGILNAISVVSKRLARKLTMLEKPPDEGRDKTDGTAETAAANAD
jgi:hypothetical protein